jgi:serine/threonine protein kinase
LSACAFAQENVLLKRTAGTDEQPVFSAKIADFGMVADELSSSSSPSDGDDGGEGTGSVAAHAWKGTYLYMSPEATGMNAEKGYPKGRIATNREEPLFGASDSFSFGVMLLIMMTRDARWFETDGLQLPSIIGKDGKPQEDMKTVATWYFNGKRPQFEASFPPLLRLLIEGCWGDKQSDRLRFSEIEALLKNDKIDWLAAPPADETETYQHWLERVGVAGKTDKLAEWDVKEQANSESKELGPLEKLQAMLKEEQDDEVEDFAEMLEDVFEDEEEVQASFRAEVEKLVEASSGSEVGGGHASFQAVVHQIIACHAFAQVTQGATAKEKLLAMLPASEQEKQIAQLQESVVELAAERTELQSVVAQQHEELALLRERLASFEREAEA